MPQIAPWKPLYEPITDKTTIARLVNHYGLVKGMEKATGLCPHTAADWHRWNKLGRRG
jgi:hypothetical protein